MSEWENVKLSDLVKFGNGKARPNEIGIIPVYGGNGILHHTNTYNYDSETIIIGRVGAYCGSVYFENKPIWVSDNALSAKSKSGYNAKFLYYLLKDLDLNQYAQGSSHPLLTQTLLNSIEIETTRSIPEQKAIADVLSALDDKIDLLHCQNHTLEQMAETLFRQWFVEEAQEDWEEKNLDFLFDISSGKSLNRKDFDDFGTFDVLGANGKIGKSNHYNFNEKLIFTGRVGTLGKVFIVDNYPVWLSDNTLVIKNIKYFYFTYFLLKNNELETYNVGSTQPLIRQGDIKQISFLLPYEEKILFFERVVSSFFQKINANKQQIQTLATLRDTLLPKLISGEVRVAFQTA